MKSGSYFILLLLGVICVGLSVALILVAHKNQSLQVQLQARQQALNSGILGQQGQQVSAGVLQDMATASEKNQRIRRLLEAYGYRLQSASQPETATNAVAKKAQARKP